MSENERELTRLTDTLEWPVPKDEHAAMKAYERDPIVYQLVRKYAEENDCTVEETIYGSTGDVVGYPAPLLGLVKMAKFLETQERLNEKYWDARTE